MIDLNDTGKDVIPNIKGSLNNIRWFAMGAYSSSQDRAFLDIFDNLNTVIKMFDSPDENCKMEVV